jgi:hypothetical protein
MSGELSGLNRTGLGTAVVALTLVTVILAGITSLVLVAPQIVIHPSTTTATFTVTYTSIMTSISISPTTVTHTTTTTVLTKATSPYASMITKDNLRMDLTLNASRVPLGGAVQITMNLTNVLNLHSLVAMSSAWPISGLVWPPSPCYSFYLMPIGLAVFAGYYVVGNVTSGKPMYIVQDGVHSCPYVPNFSGYLFDPFSNTATLTQDDGYVISVYSSTNFSGYWAGGTPPFYYDQKFSQFSPGLYTVVEGDEWGDAVFLYFTVG